MMRVISIISGVAIAVLSAMAQAVPAAGFTAEMRELEPTPKGGQVNTVFPGIVPGTFLLKQSIYVSGDPSATTVCFYLMKGAVDADVGKAVRVENILGWQCGPKSQPAVAQ